MAVIVNSASDDDFVGNIKGSVSDMNKARISWDWPKNQKYDLCIVFDIQEDADLEALLKSRSNREVYEGDFNLTHSAVIAGKYIQFKIYPARKTGSGELEIINQAKNNLSPRFLKKARLFYSVEYKKQKLGQGSGQTATVKIKPVSEICEDYICYQITGGNKQNVKYGVDKNKFCCNGSFVVYLNRGEEIHLILDDKQKEYVELTRV